MKHVTVILDDKARTLAKEYLRTEGQLLSVLIEMRRERAFAELNYTGIFDYCERALNFSRAQAFYFKTVAEKSEEVPEIKQAVVRGELTLSQARRIAPVITPQNQKEWIEKAKTLPQVELEREVTAVNPKAHVTEKIRPVARELAELRVGLDPKTEQNLKTLRDILSQKLGKPATMAEVIAWVAETARDKFDPVRKAQRAISSGNRPPKKPTSPGRQKIPAAIKHPVVLRDNMQCTFVGPNHQRCTQRRWLDIHHVKEVSRGGRDTPSNLRILCRSHHRMLHNEAHSRRLL